MALRIVLIVSALLAAAPAAMGATYIGCGSRQDFAITARPRACFLDWPDLPDAGAVYLHRIHWRAWGSRVAPATAVWRYRTFEPWTRVKVWAYGRQRCGRGFLYTRVRVRGTEPDGHRWAKSWRMMRCSDVPGD